MMETARQSSLPAHEDGAAAASSRSKNELQFRSVHALNNMAVRMMENGCYQQAFQTLQDAVFLLETISESGPATATTTPQQGGTRRSQPSASTQRALGDLFNRPPVGPAPQANAQETLERANRRLARPEVSAQGLSVGLSAVSQNETFLWTSICRLNTGSSSPTTDATRARTPVPLIRMDSEGLYAPPPAQRGSATGLQITFNETAYLLTAVVLYNLSIATVCNAASRPLLPAGSGLPPRRVGPSVTDVQYDMAIFLILSQNLLDSLFRNCKDPFVMASVVFISGMVLQALAQSLQVCGRLREASSCMQQLQQLDSVARQLLVAEVFQTKDTSAPAA